MRPAARSLSVEEGSLAAGVFFKDDAAIALLSVVDWKKKKKAKIFPLPEGGVRGGLKEAPAADVLFL
jgi:hypothetical protein